MKTRSKPAVKPPQAESEPPSNTLAPSEADPPKLFILPKGTTAEARIITLSNPATSAPNRYYFCPQKGFYEFTKIAAPRRTPRSWLLAPPRDVRESKRAGKEEGNGHETGAHEDAADGQEADTRTGQEPSTAAGYITKSADLFVAAPIDPLFLVLPALAPSSTSSREAQKQQLFLSADDHLDNLSTSSSHLRQLLRDHNLGPKIKERIAAVCDTVDAGDAKMYRLSHAKLLHELLAKAQRMASGELPASMEERFVRRALEAPIASVRREEEEEEEDSSTASGVPDSSTTTTTTTTTTAPPTTQSESESPKQTPSTPRVDPRTSQARVSSPPASPTAAPTDTTHLLRVRVSLTFLLSSYIPPALRPALTALLSGPSSRLIHFAPLDARLARLASLRAEQRALRGMSDNVGRKRPLGAGGEDDGDGGAGAEKRRRREEEETRMRKTGESRGVRELRKVDVSGMRKLSSFFTSKAPAGGKKGKAG